MKLEVDSVNSRPVGLGDPGEDVEFGALDIYFQHSHRVEAVRVDDVAHRDDGTSDAFNTCEHVRRDASHDDSKDESGDGARDAAENSGARRALGIQHERAHEATDGGHRVLF